MKKGSLAIIAVLILALLVVGCAQKPAATQQPAPTQQPTSTQQPAPAPAPTAKPTTAPTPAPTPTPTAKGPALTFPLTLKFETYLPQGNVYVSQDEWFFNTVAQRSGGRLKIEYYYNSALHPADQVATAIGKGIVDVGDLAIGYIPSLVPLSSAFDIPYLGLKMDASTKAIDEITATYTPVANEWKKLNLRIIHQRMTGPTMTATKAPLPDIASLKGKKMRGMGWMADVMRLLGANGMSIVWGECYTALQTGTIDGLTGGGFQAAWNIKFHEVAPYWTEIGSGLYSLCPVVMNQDLWNKLPDDLKQVFNKAEEEYMLKMTEFQMVEEAKALDDMVAKGVKFAVWSKDEIEKGRKLVHPALSNLWLDKMQALNLRAEGEEVLKRYTALLAKYEPASNYKTGFEVWQQKYGKK